MRPGMIVASAILALGLHGHAFAVEVNEQGARTLKSDLARMLSDDLVKSGFVTVKPAKDVYEVTFDLAKFLDKISSSDFSINGLKPLTMLVTPLANNLWNIAGNADVNLSSQSRLGHGPITTTDYAVDALVYSGVFDPAISYMRSADLSAKQMRLTSVTGPERLEASAAGMSYKLAAIDSATAGRVDFHANGSLPSFEEKITSPSAPDMAIRADSLDFNASATEVPIRQVRDLVRFVFEHIKAKTLSRKGSDRFETLARNALPVFATFQENVAATNLSVATENGQGQVRKLDYSLKTNGVVNAARIDFGLNAEDISLNSALVPDTFAPLVPQAASLQVDVPNMNFADAMDVMLHADFSRSPPLTKEQSDRLGSLIFPEDKLVVELGKLQAKSPVYDIDVSGKMTADIRRRGNYTLQATILVGDYDKAIAFIQDAAKTNPKLTQVSFGMLMAKGFAKTDPDGRQRWEVAVGGDGTVTVNGQVMKTAGAQ